jgi:hypothetical protein
MNIINSDLCIIQMMHSEWLLEKPEDFQENWIMIPVPQGKRNLVIASGVSTGQEEPSDSIWYKYRTRGT